MRYLFILGRNIPLSKLEVFSYFEKEKNEILNYSIIKNGLLLDLKNPLRKNLIKDFGGIVSIGEIMFSGNSKNIEEKIKMNKIYFGKNNKLNYALWNFSKYTDFVGKYLKEWFKKEKIKTTLKHLTGGIKLQGGKIARTPSSKLIEEEYFVFDEEENIYFGRITEKCDYSSIEKRDMEKPVRRESLAISPRLAKIMINLAQLNEEEILLDPFCGVGTILQEALLKKIKVIGIDKNSEAILGAEKNLKWFNFSNKNYTLFNSNSIHFKISEASAIVTEPDFGETLKKIPTKEKAEKILREFEKLIVRVLNNFKKQIKGRIVFTSPYIRIGKKQIAINIKNILKKTNLKLVYEGIPEFRENQIVGRIIFVLDNNFHPKSLQKVL